MKDTICNIKGCDNPEYSRGICTNHYQKYVYRIRKGKTSWKELQDKGITKPLKSEIIDDEPDNKKGSFFVDDKDIAAQDLTMSSVSDNDVKLQILNPFNLDLPLNQDQKRQKLIDKFTESIKDKNVEDIIVQIFHLK